MPEPIEKFGLIISVVLVADTIHFHLMRLSRRTEPFCRMISASCLMLMAWTATHSTAFSNTSLDSRCPSLHETQAIYDANPLKYGQLILLTEAEFEDLIVDKKFLPIVGDDIVIANPVEGFGSGGLYGISGTRPPVQGTYTFKSGIVDIESEFVFNRGHRRSFFRGAGGHVYMQDCRPGGTPTALWLEALQSEDASRSAAGTP